jgi:hypothetical protein
MARHGQRVREAPYFRTMSEPSAAPDPAHDAVVAAAIAASTWVRRRRSAWAGDAPLPPLRIQRSAPEPPAEAPVVPAAEAAPVAPFAPPPVQPSVAAREAFAPAPPPQAIEPPPPPPAAPRGPSALSRAVVAARDLAGRALESWRIAAAVIAVAAIGVGLFKTVPAAWRYVTVKVRTGSATFESVPPGAGVSVDGIVIGQAPITRRLPVGQHTIEFHTRTAHRSMTLDVSPLGENIARVDWTAKATGQLHVESSPDGAQVIVDGKERGVAPLTLEVPVGAHTVLLRNADGSVQRNVTITSGNTTNVSEGIFAGFLHVAAGMDVTVSEGSRVFTLDERGQALISAGPHVLQIRNAAMGFSETRRVEITPGEVFNLEVTAQSTLSVTSTIPARVIVDGTDAGSTPLADYPVSVGAREVLVIANTGHERRTTVHVTTAPARLDVDFFKQ